MGQKHNFLIFVIIGAVLATSCSDLPAQSATDIYWADGDSGTLDGLEFRLSDLDAPETGPVGSPRGAKGPEEQRAGYAAKDYMRAQTHSSVVSYSVHDKDRYGRIVVRVSVDGVSLEPRAMDAGHLKPWPHINGKPVRSKPDWCRS